jgi:redox-sensing transcriptional repressor
MPDQTPDRAIGRLSIYRRVLTGLCHEGVTSIFSRGLAEAAGVTAVQVRRDIMLVGSSGSPAKGYDVEELIDGIARFLDATHRQPLALVGVGNLGRAILTYFPARRSNLVITAAFDSDPFKTGRVINGCRCHSMAEMSDIVAEQGIETAILAVPAVEAQAVTDKLVAAGVKGIMNFAPARLRVPGGVFIEDIDITASLEKVAFFARQDEKASPLPNR